MSDESGRNELNIRYILSKWCIACMHHTNILGGHNNDIGTKTQTLHDKLIQTA